MRLLGILASLATVIWVVDCRGIGGLEIGDDVGDLTDEDFCYGKLAGGFYADVESKCTKFHACMLDTEGKSMDIVFSCVNGTLFDQRSRSCKVEEEVVDICNRSQDYFGRNVDLYSVKENHLQDRRRRDVFDIEDIEDTFEGEEEDEPEVKEDKLEMKDEDRRKMRLELRAETTTVKEEINSNSIKLPKIPETKFRCSTKKMGDYYADPETDCQLFHVCAVGFEGEILDFRFLCLNNTRFNPKTRTCEDARVVPCVAAPRGALRLPAVKEMIEDKLAMKSENRVDPEDAALEDEEEEEVRPKKISEDRRSKPKEVEIEEEEEEDEVKPKKTPSEERRSKPKGSNADERPKSRGRQKRPPEQRLKKDIVEIEETERKKREIVVSPVFDVVREGVRLKRQSFDPPRYNRNFLPRTSFTCKGKVAGGYYADPETDCQMYHVCAPGTLGSLTDFKFLCSNDTVFNQQTRTCVDYELVDCANAVAFYSINDDLIKSPEIEEEEFDIPKARPPKQPSPGRKKQRKNQKRPNPPPIEETPLSFQPPQPRLPVQAEADVPPRFQDADFAPAPRTPPRAPQSLPAFATDDGFSAPPARGPSRSSQRPSNRQPQRIIPLQEEFQPPAPPPRAPPRTSQKPSRQRVPIEDDFSQAPIIPSDRPIARPPPRPIEQEIPQVQVRGPSRSAERPPSRQSQRIIPLQEEFPPQAPFRPPPRQNSAPRQRPIPIEAEFQPPPPVREPARAPQRQSQRPIPVDEDFQPVQVRSPSRSSQRNAPRQRIIPLQEEFPSAVPIQAPPRSSRRPVQSNFDAIPVDESQFATVPAQADFREVQSIPQQSRRKPSVARAKMALPDELSDFFRAGPPPAVRVERRPPVARRQFDEEEFLPSSQVFHLPRESRLVGIYTPPPSRTRRSTDGFVFRGFSCQNKKPGVYYADITTGCSMFHVCALGSKEMYDFKFLCTNDTLFDQYSQNCLPKDKVNCRPISNLISRDINRGRREIETAVEGSKKTETVPKTSFSCRGKTNGEYFADAETDCRTFHMCMRDIAGDSVDFVFQCLDSTAFNMKTKTCDSQEKVQCKYDQSSENKNTQES